MQCSASNRLGNQTIPLSPSSSSLFLDEIASDTSTKIEDFSTTHFRESNDSTPNFLGKSDSKPKLTFSQSVIKFDLELVLQVVEEVKKKAWAKAEKILSEIQNPDFKDVGYSEAAKTAAEMARDEILGSNPKVSWSTTTLRAYAFCNKILHPKTHNDTIKYIEDTIPEKGDEIEGPITHEMDAILADITFSDLAEQAAVDMQWGKAESYLEKIQDSLWRDAAYSAITKIAANAAIDASKTHSYNNKVIRANTFCQGITDPEILINTGIILKDMLEKKRKAPLGERLSTFGNELIPKYSETVNQTV